MDENEMKKKEILENLEKVNEMFNPPGMMKERMKHLVDLRYTMSEEMESKEKEVRALLAKLQQDVARLELEKETLDSNESLKTRLREMTAEIVQLKQKNQETKDRMRTLEKVLDEMHARRSMFSEQERAELAAYEAELKFAALCKTLYVQLSHIQWDADMTPTSDRWKGQILSADKISIIDLDGKDSATSCNRLWNLISMNLKID